MADPKKCEEEIARGLRGGDSCVLWTGRASTAGYGAMLVDGRARQVTHLVLERSGQPRPSGMFALHACDNPPCINVDHLRWGTHRDNMHDKVQRARLGQSPIAPGEQHFNAKLTVELVRQIRNRAAAGEVMLRLASEYQVCYRTICDVVHRRSWQHV